MDRNKKKTISQSFLAGSLTSTAGLFMAKLIGLIYIIPFKEIIGQQNMVYFSASYDYYVLLLQISAAGIPFAIAALVAKYIAKEDYKTVILVRHLGTGILMTSGFVMAFLFLVFSKSLASRALGVTHLSTGELATMQNVFAILALSLFVVPILSSYRGYYQGLKEMVAFANSQVIEQVVRVSFILIVSMFAIYVFKLHASFGAYAAVMGTCLGAVLAIFYFLHFNSLRHKEVIYLASLQKNKKVSCKHVVHEFILYAIPFFITAILGNSQILVNTNLFVSINQSLGMPHDKATLIYSIIQTNCDKLTSIPQVISAGFSAGIIPFVTSAMERHDFKEMRKYLMKAFDVTLFLAIPVSSVLFFQSRFVYYIMYGAKELAYGQVALRQAGILALSTTLTPLVTSILLTLRFRKKSIVYLAIGFIVKLLSFYPLTYCFGYTGAIISSYFSSFVILGLGFIKIQNYSHLQWWILLRRLLKILFLSLIMNIPYFILTKMGIDLVNFSRILSLIIFAFISLLAMLIYFYLADSIGLLKVTLNYSMHNIFRKIFRRF